MSKIDIAKNWLSYYFRMVGTKAGLNWDINNDVEVEAIIDLIVEGISEMKQELKENEMLRMPIEELGLSTRAYNCLKRAGKNTLKDVCSMSEREIYSIRQMGSKTVSEVMNVLAKHGLFLRGQKEAAP